MFSDIIFCKELIKYCDKQETIRLGLLLSLIHKDFEIFRKQFVVQ